MIDKHQYEIETKKSNRKNNKYKFSLEELLNKRKEMNNWSEVAEYYGISLATLKRHKKELEELSNGGIA